jgi:DNA-binding SARP family transcriptional activator
VDVSVGASVETPVESTGPGRGRGTSLLRVQLLGPLTISRDGVALPLPASRKVRALIAYLSLAPKATRSQLCELLWDVPNDPRGELRWCLSKIRRIVDQPHHRRIDAHADTIRLDLSDCDVDAIEIARATQEGVDTLSVDRLRKLSALFAGDFLDGLEIDRSPLFSDWLIAQRRRFRGCPAVLLDHLVRNVSGDEAFGYLEELLELAPFDLHVHETLFNALARRGRIREGEEHLEAAARLFEVDEFDPAPLREAWRAARAQADGSPPVNVTARGTVVAPSSDSGKHGLIATRRASIVVMPFVD